MPLLPVRGSDELHQHAGGEGGYSVAPKRKGQPVKALLSKLIQLASASSLMLFRVSQMPFRNILQTLLPFSKAHTSPENGIARAFQKIKPSITVKNCIPMLISILAWYPDVV